MFYFLIILFFPYFTASAAGLQVSPARLDFDMPAQGEEIKKIIISNPSADLQLFEIYADDFTDIISINPRTFSLESGARQEVAISVTASQNTELKQSNLSIIARPFSTENIVISSASKIPITITQNTPTNANNKIVQNNLWYIGGLVLLSIFLLVYIIYLHSKFKKIHPDK